MKTTTKTDEVTRDDIERLYKEACAANDFRVIVFCRLALRGSLRARLAAETHIREARRKV